jgi:hypothetical protein
MEKADPRAALLSFDPISTVSTHGLMHLPNVLSTCLFGKHLKNKDASGMLILHLSWKTRPHSIKTTRINKLFYIYFIIMHI